MSSSLKRWLTLLGALLALGDYLWWFHAQLSPFLALIWPATWAVVTEGLAWNGAAMYLFSTLLYDLAYWGLVVLVFVQAALAVWGMWHVSPRLCAWVRSLACWGLILILPLFVGLQLFFTDLRLTFSIETPAPSVSSWEILRAAIEPPWLWITFSGMVFSLWLLFGGFVLIWVLSRRKPGTPSPS